MAFPEKFRHLLEIELRDVDTPDHAWITYAVCGLTPDACGWQGWILESLFKKDAKETNANADQQPLPIDNFEQRCPRCRRLLFRTSATMRFAPSANQASPQGRPGVDYDTSPLDYE